MIAAQTAIRKRSSSFSQITTLWLIPLTNRLLYGIISYKHKPQASIALMVVQATFHLSKEGGI
jgi:hypothetical protein